MGTRENECQISQNYILHMKFSEFYLWNLSSCQIWHSFSRTSMRNFLWGYYRWFITSLALQKCKKKNAILFKLFWYKIFVHWKLKLLDFLMDSVLTLGKANKALRAVILGGCLFWKWVLRWCIRWMLVSYIADLLVDQLTKRLAKVTGLFENEDNRRH